MQSMARIIPALHRREIRKVQEQLGYAVDNGDAEGVYRLVQAGGFITAHEIRRAILAGSVAIARFLIGKGGNISGKVHWM